MIRSIDLNVEGALPKSRIKELLGVQVGDVVSEQELDKGLKRLANTGRYQGLELNFDDETGRLRLDVRLFDILQGVQINFSKNDLDESLEEILRKDISNISSLAINDQISVDMLPELRARIEARLESRGFYRPKVVLALQEGQARYSRTLIVDLSLGKQSMVQTLRFKGFKGADLGELRSLLERAEYTQKYLKALDPSNDLINNPEEYLLERIQRLRRADQGEVVRFDITFPADKALLNETLNAWGKRMRQEGYFDFQIENQIYQKDDKRVLEIVLNRGKEYDIQFLGNVNFWERSLRKTVLDRPIRLGIPFNLNDAKSAVRSRYLNEGFMDIRIESEIQENEKTRTVYLKITEGTQYFLGNINWTGLSPREELALQPIEDRWKESMSHPFHHIYFNEKQIKSQVPDLQNMLRSAGYLQSRFLGFSAEKSKSTNIVNIQLPIQLGPKFKVRKVALEDRESLEKLFNVGEIPIRSGEVASSSKILSVSNELREQARESGFLLAEVPNSLEEIVTYSDNSDEVDLLFRVNLGPKQQMGQIVTEGLRKTKEEVVLREFEREEMTTGDVWVPSKLERIDERLLGYGLFNNLRMKASDPRQAVGDQPSSFELQERDLRIVLTERPGGAVEFGPGYRTDVGLIAFGEVNYRNLGGMNRSVVARAQVSRKIENYQFPEQKYSLSFLEPYTAGFALASRLSLVYERRDDRQYNSDGVAVDGFNVEEASISLALAREITENLTLRLNTYTISVPRIFDLVGEDTAAGRLRYRIATVGPELEWDRRDNIFTPSAGFLLQNAFEYSGPSIGSGENVHFMLLRNELSYYKSLRKSLVLALSGGYSYMRALQESTGIPENKRLVSGGRATIRSLPEKKLRFDQTGVREMSSALVKAELRQGIFGEVGVAYFFDMGRVDAIDYESEGWRKAVGVGLRYQTPVGPLALDFAFNMDKRSGEDFSRVLFSVGVF